MPQPLSSLKIKRMVSIGSNTDSPARHRPALALSAMNLIAEWSLLEGFINGMFAQLLGANPGPSAAIFATIRSPQGQRDAMRAVVDAALADQAERDIIFAMLSVYDAASGLRNRVAHWVWGHAYDLPNAVLLANPTAYADFQSRIASWSLSAREDPMKASPPPALDYRQVFAYEQSDFDEASARIQRAIELVHRVTSTLMTFRLGGLEGAPGLLLLSSEPEIHAELERLNARREKQRQAQPQPPRG